MTLGRVHAGPTARFTLAPTPHAARSARELVAPRLAATDLSRQQREDAELLVSELVTNAVLHARTEIRLDLHVGEHLRVAVADRSEAMPHLDRHRLVGGWGLQLVDRLAAVWGVERLATGGKAVWFEMRGAGAARAD
jgi:anti-sigma regulatory factor (Ser/Thr protein kinase)